MANKRGKAKDQIDYRALQRGLADLSQGLSGINQGLTVALSEIPDSALSFMNEKTLARRYEDLFEATQLAEELGGMKIRKRALWLPWKRREPRVIYVPMPGQSQQRRAPDRIDLREVWKWLRDSPESSEKGAILSRIQLQKDYQASLGNTRPKIHEIITRDLLNEIFEYSNLLRKKRMEYLDKHPIEDISSDPRKQAHKIIQNVYREYISLIEKKYLKELREYREKVEKALILSAGNPALNRKLRIVLLKINKIQQILMTVINRYSTAILRV